MSIGTLRSTPLGSTLICIGAFVLFLTPVVYFKEKLYLYGEKGTAEEVLRVIYDSFPVAVVC